MPPEDPISPTAQYLRYALIDDLFTYHTPNDIQIGAMQQIREKAKELARLIDALVPPSADRTDAMRKLMECVNTANRGITLKGVTYR